MKILLTGSSGFIGRHVLDIIKKRNEYEEILVMSGAEKGYNSSMTRWIPSQNYDFSAEYLLKMNADVDIIIHMGAFTPKSMEEANWINKSTSNIVSTKNLLRAVDLCNNVKKIIYISTLDVYEETDARISELSPTIPSSMYGWSKLYCEQMIQTFSKKRNIQYEILRLGHVFGAGEDRYQKVIPVMIQTTIQNKAITIWGNGEALRTFIYVDDAAEAIVKSIDHPVSDIINVVGNETIAINSLAYMIERISGRKVAINHIQMDVPQKNVLFDNTRLKQSLLSSFTPLEKGIKKEYEYFLEKSSVYK